MNRDEVLTRPGMNWQERIVVDPQVLLGKPIVKGTRISVEFVVDSLAEGRTREQILQEYDHLTPEDVQACLGYASELLKSARDYPPAAVCNRPGVRFSPSPRSD